MRNVIRKITVNLSLRKIQLAEKPPKFYKLADVAKNFGLEVCS